MIRSLPFTRQGDKGQASASPSQRQAGLLECWALGTLLFLLCSFLRGCPGPPHSQTATLYASLLLLASFVKVVTHFLCLEHSSVYLTQIFVEWSKGWMNSWIKCSSLLCLWRAAPSSFPDTQYTSPITHISFVITCPMSGFSPLKCKFWPFLSYLSFYFQPLARCTAHSKLLINIGWIDEYILKFLILKLQNHCCLCEVICQSTWYTNIAAKKCFQSGVVLLMQLRFLSSVFLCQGS